MQIKNYQENSPYIPSDAYLYFPKNNNTARKNGGQREFFDGNIQFDASEKQSINEFKAYSIKHNYTLKAMWTDNMILRFLYANNFKMNKTLSSIKEHTIWRETKLPVLVDEPLQKILDSGLLYVHGRDNEFRPIVIFNVHLLDPKNVDVELITRALTYWFEHVINEWMLPGQIENWVFIADVKGMGVTTLLQQNIRKLFIYLQDNYKCRLHKLYILNVTSALYTPWQVIKRLLDEVTVQKIQICKGAIPTGILDSVNPEQVEKKYGGAAPNSTHYWPPVISSNNFFVKTNDANALITEEEYTALYNNGSLVNMRIDKSRIEHSISTSSQSEEALPQTVEPAYSSETPCNPCGIELVQSLRRTESRDDSMGDADYLEYMSERLEYNQREIVVREFHSSFISKVALH